MDGPGPLNGPGLQDGPGPLDGSWHELKWDHVLLSDTYLKEIANMRVFTLTTPGEILGHGDFRYFLQTWTWRHSAFKNIYYYIYNRMYYHRKY